MIARLALPLLAAGLLAAQEPAAVPAGPAAADSVPTAAVVRPLPRKSPGRAVLLSFLIPGGGQVYTGNAWKAFLIAPAELTLAYLSVRDHRAATAALGAGDEERYVALRDRRNTLLFFTGAVLAYSMADAWVSARMYAFERQMEFAVGPGRVSVRAGF